MSPVDDCFYVMKLDPLLWVVEERELVVIACRRAMVNDMIFVILYFEGPIMNKRSSFLEP